MRGARASGRTSHVSGPVPVGTLYFHGVFVPSETEELSDAVQEDGEEPVEPASEDFLFVPPDEVLGEERSAAELVVEQ